MNRLPIQNVHRPHTVLVLDDDDALRGGAVRVLARSGYRVLEASSAAEALCVSGDWTDPIDLLLCDLVLPRLGGREAASALLARRPGMRVIFTSGFRSRDSFRRDLEQPCNAFLAKPFEVPQLLDAVSAVLRGESWPSDRTRGLQG